MAGLVIFDLDGVLVDSRELHYVSLNKALSEVDNKYVISELEQETIYEGLTTKDKLEILTKLKGLPKEKYNDIWMAKQQYSSKMFESLSIDSELIDLFQIIKKAGSLIAVASNSIRSTVDTCLTNLGVAPFISLALSNEDVYIPKPDPMIYLKCMSILGFDANNTVVFEDSIIGKQAAIASGAKLFEISCRADVTISAINKALYELEN